MKTSLEHENSETLVKTERIPEPLKTIAKHILMFLCGILLGSVDDLSSVSPFGVALTAAVPSKYILSAGLGAAAGYILTQDSVSGLRYIAALVCAGVLSRVMCEFEKIKKFKLLPSCISFLACFLSSVAVLAANGLNTALFLIYVGEALLAFVSSFFFSSAMATVSEGKAVHGFSQKELGTFLGAVFLILLSVSDIAVFSISLPRIIICFAVVFCAFVFRESGGAVAGILAGFILSVSEGVGACGAAFAVGGLLGGIFSYSKKWVTSVSFFLSFLTAYLFADGGRDKYYLLIEAFTAALVFAVLPDKLIIRAEAYLLPQNDAPDCNAQREAVLSRLISAAQAVDDIERSVSAVSARLEGIDKHGEDKILLEIQNSVCAVCGRYDFCWEQNFDDTKKAFGLMDELLKSGEMLSPSNTPSPFSSRCIRQTTLTDTYNKLFAAYSASEAAEKKIDEIRSVTADQFGSISDMLLDLSEEFSQKIVFDTVLAEKIRSAVENEFPLRTETVSCYRDDGGRICIEISFAQGPKELNIAVLRDTVNEVCARKFDLPVIRSDRSVRFCERTDFTVETASAQIPADNEKLCGDTFESFFDGRGNYIVILSDGMGTGPRAALDSAMASGLMARLVKAGFGFSSSLKLVNSSLLLKSKDESLATLDILKINLYTGVAVFYKAGAASSVIKRKNKMLEIKRAALPAGILRDAVFASCEGKVEDGDTIIIASDGAFDYSKNSVKEELKRSGEEQLSSVATKISRRAKSAKGNVRCDDITVIALNIKKRA